MKTLADIQTGLATKYTGIMKQVDSYSYIPWNEAVKVANDLLDVDGYDVEIKQVWREDVPNTEGVVASGYAGIVRVTIRSTDGEPFIREGLGFSELIFTQERHWTDKKTGEDRFVPSRALIDTAIKGVVSRALLRALCLLGDSFGLFLYDKEDTQASTGAASGQSRGGNQQSEPLTDSQKNYLRTLKVPDVIISQLNKKTGSQMINDIKNNKPREEVYAPFKQKPETKTEYAWDDEKVPA